MFAEKGNKAKSFDELSKEAKQVKNDAAKVKNDAVDYAKENPQGAVRQAKEKAREAGKNVYNFIKNNSHKLKEVEETASEKIKSRPLISAAVIFGTGLILGSALKRSRKE